MLVLCLVICLLCIGDYKSSTADCIIAIITLLTCFIAYIQLKKINTTDSSRFLLELRTAFSEGRRWTVHCDIKDGRVDDEYVKENGAKIDDYLGLFEICEEMIANGSLTKKTFKKLYYFRLECIIKCKAIVDYLKGSYIFWGNFYNLIKRFPKLEEKFNESKSDSKGSMSKTDDSASKTKNGLQFKKIEI